MRRITRHVAALMLVSFGLSIVVPPMSAEQQEQPKITKKDLKSRIAAARTPSEHRAIANYYQTEAQRFAAQAKEHEEMAKQYLRNSLPYESKFPAGTVGVSHCRQWAATYAKKAEEAQSQANLHEEMAQAAENK